jgi:hypothetical protein
MTEDDCFVRVEYDLDYTGGNYERQGSFVLLPWREIKRCREDVEGVFERMTGHSRVHIVHYSVDDLYTATGEYAEGV